MGDFPQSRKQKAAVAPDRRYESGKLYASGRVKALVKLPACDDQIIRVSPGLMESIVSSAFEAGCEFITGGNHGHEE